MIFADTAPHYYKVGLPVMPLNGKAAILPGWPKYGKTQAPTADEQKAWLTGYPNHNIGLAFGEVSGLAAIDIDDPAVEQQILDLIPASPCHRRGKKGLQAYYKASPGLKSFSIKDPETGHTVVECLSSGKQGVLAPSIHPDTGLPYTANVPLYEVLDELPELPYNVQEILEEGLGFADCSKRGASKPGGNGRKIKKSGRHTAACKTIGTWVAKGMTGDRLRSKAHEWNLNRCDPPLEGAELNAILDDACNKWAQGDGLPTTDVGNAMRLANRIDGKICFVDGWNSWATYVGGRWQRDPTNGAIGREAQEVAMELATSEVDALWAWGSQSQSFSHIQSMIKLAKIQNGVVVSASAFDNDPNLLNTPDGVWDLRTGQRMENSPDFMMSQVTDVAAAPSMETPIFDAFLTSVFEGHPDRRRFFELWMGYCLTGHVSERAFLVGCGNGKNGKSLAFTLMRTIMGSYASVVSMSALMLSRHPEGPQPEIANLKGKRFVAASEGKEGQRLNTALVKNLTGLEPITARRLNENPVEFTPQVKIALGSNFVPEFDGSDQAVVDRLKLLPFEQRFEGEREDPLLPEKLKAEYPGILAKMIGWAGDWYQEGLCTPASVNAAVHNLRQEMDSISSFLDDCCSAAPETSTPLSHLYECYQDYARGAGMTIKSKLAFGRELIERGYPEHRTQTARCRKGLKLNRAPFAFRFAA